MTFKNLNDVMDHIEKDMQKALENEVANAVKDNMIKAVDKTVYGAYLPRDYKRRMENGGLTDRNNLAANVSGNVLTVRDIAPLDNGKTKYALDEIIVYGKGRQPFPRDFYGDTVERLENNGEHVEAMKDGLRKRGYKIK